MARLFIVISIFLFSENVFGNRDSTHFFNEYSLSLNKPVFESPYNKEKVGFGFGVYHLMRKEKIISFKLGLEFNRTRRLDELYYSNSTDQVAYILNEFPLPMSLRISLGKKVKFIFDTGIFIDYYINSLRQELRQGRKIRNLGFDLDALGDGFNKSKLDGGYSLGIGTRIPFKKRYLIVKYEFANGIKFYSYSYLSSSNKYSRLVFGIQL